MKKVNFLTYESTHYEIYQCQRMVFQLSLSDSKSHPVTRTLLSILADLNNAVVSMVSPWPLFSKSFRPSTNPLVTVSRAPITFDIIVTSKLFSVLHQCLDIYLSFRFPSVLCMVSRNANAYYLTGSFFFFLFFFFFFF